MEINVSHVQSRVDITVLELIGRLNLGTTPKLDKLVQEEYDAGMRYLLIDVSQLDSMTSAGLRSIQAIYKMLHSESHTEGDGEDAKKSPFLILLNPQSNIRRDLKITGFDLFIPIFEDRQEAIKSF